MLRRLARGIVAIRRLPQAVNRTARSLMKALRTPRANGGNQGSVTAVSTTGNYEDEADDEKDAASVTSESFCATIPSRRYSYRDHWYPSDTDEPTEPDEDDSDYTEELFNIRRPAPEDARPEPENVDGVDERDSDSDRVRSGCSESSGVSIPLRRTNMFDPSNRYFDPAYPSRVYLTRGGHETVARAEYSYSDRYYRTFSETSLE